ncbi:uncharacterized protein LOC107366266 isoform X2 [Tetranychus urticae]|uniref:F-box domain-containing protein n=1 Tax=Tetranychus urticae TaxID=32264 RepID=T1JRU1_TETUR|nr:uncharacterized protein LOC107366266 isoform X2 [Tetranychus urticae]
MFINELPEECLLIIFGLINELDDLLNCYKVSTKWSHLIAERTRKVKYLIEHRDWWNYEPSLSYPFDYVYYQTEEPIDGTCLSTLFPNLSIADFAGLREKVKHEDLVTLVKNIKSFKGLIDRVYRDEESIFRHCGQLEMVSTDNIELCILEDGIKQLHLENRNLHVRDFKQNAHYLPNLERLHIYLDGSWSDSYYDGPKLKRLKILELFLFVDCFRDIYYGFQFMDSCPNLQSAHISLQYDHIFVDESYKNESLQDLVIEFYRDDCYESFDWDGWKRLFMKYPNLKHLAMCSFKNLENEHVEQIVRILPNLVLFAVRGCPKVIQEAVQSGRSIKFYFDENYPYRITELDWPHLSTKREKISQGFDFMKHCFLKDFDRLSTFLISNED